MLPDRAPIRKYFGFAHLVERLVVGQSELAATIGLSRFAWALANDGTTGDFGCRLALLSRSGFAQQLVEPLLFTGFGE